MKMTITEMENYCKENAMKWWGLKFGFIPITVNSRLKKVGGRFIFNKSKSIMRIEMSEQVMKYATRQTIEKVLLHELTHWALCKLNKPFLDNDAYFIKETIRVNCSRGLLPYGEMYETYCTCCKKKLSQVLTSNRAKNIVKKYVTHCCDAKIDYTKIIIEDMNKWN
jgi:SprT-like protein